MKVPKSFTMRGGISRVLLALLALAIAAGLFAGCRAAGPPAPTGTTNVMVLLTSTSNDKVVGFGLIIASIALVDNAGKSVTIYNNPNASGWTASGPAEWMHLNGRSEPLVTVAVPQGIYTSAIVKAGGCGFWVVAVGVTGGLGQYGYTQGTCAQGTGETTVNLPSPITISGPAMALSLNLQIPQSYTLTGSDTTTPASYTISPVFTLTPVAISSQPTNEQNGKTAAIAAQITSINSAGNSFVAKTPNGISLDVSADNRTTYQGIAGFSSLAVGMLVDMDLAIQSDASLLAIRVEVQDAGAPAVFIGPVFRGPGGPGMQADQFEIMPLQQQGCNPATPPVCGILFQYDTNTVFGISGQFSNLQNLPFTGSFSSSSLFLGQNVSVFSPGIPARGYESMTTLTLLPQTINGTVTSVSNTSGFTVYTVALAPYDMIPTAQQALNWSTNRLDDPANVIVYADTNTQFLNSSPIDAGSVLRFTGLIFDDNGTLRMDCSQILDGVPE
jgi:hypothetical protein